MRHKANRILPENLPGLDSRVILSFRRMTIRGPRIADARDSAGLTY